MSVLSKVRGFFYKHRNKVFVGGVILTGSILIVKYAQQRLKDWQEKETTEFLDRNRKVGHFESITQTCNQTIFNLSKALIGIVCKQFNTDVIIKNIKEKPEAKVQLWNSLKVAVFAKAALVIYSTVMLVITLKVQLSIIGGYLYKDPICISTEIQEAYLSLCQNFLDVGVTKLSRLIENEVEKYLQPMTLTKQLKLSDLEAIFWSIQTSLAVHKESPIEQFKYYINVTDTTLSTEGLSNLLRDTEDFLESEEIKSLSIHCINCGFILMVDKIAEFYSKQDVESSCGSNGNALFKNPFDEKKPLAKLIPVINGLLSKNTVPYDFVKQLVTSEKLNNLSANIYESLL